MRDFYLLIDGQQAGPYTAEQLHELLARGELTAESPAWYDGLPDWAHLGTILEDVALPAPVQPAPAPTASSQVVPSLESQAPVVISISKNGLRKGAYAVGLLLILFLIYYFASPFYALHALKSAVASGDSDALGNHIDFPSLRDSIKQEFKAEMMSGQPQGTGPNSVFTAIGNNIASTMVDNWIDAGATPAGTLKYLSSFGNGDAFSNYPPNPNPTITFDVPIEHAGFDSLTDFRFTYLEYKLHMHFYGMGWKIYRVEFPSLKNTADNTAPAAPAKTESSSSGDTNAVPLVAPEPPKPKHPTLDAKMGFRTYKLGTPFSQFNPDDLDAETAFAFEKSDTKSYLVKVFDKQLGAAEIDSIQLNFIQDILQSIRVSVKGKQSSLALKDTLIAAYGQPDESDTWNGDDCVLEFYNYHDDSSANFSSKSVDAKIKAITEQKAQSGAAAGAQNL
jgi:hypothetical protein